MSSPYVMRCLIVYIYICCETELSFTSVEELVKKMKAVNELERSPSATSQRRPVPKRRKAPAPPPPTVAAIRNNGEQTDHNGVATVAERRSMLLQASNLSSATEANQHHAEQQKSQKEEEVIRRPKPALRTTQSLYPTLPTSNGDSSSNEAVNLSEDRSASRNLVSVFETGSLDRKTLTNSCKSAVERSKTLAHHRKSSYNPRISKVIERPCVPPPPVPRSERSSVSEENNTNQSSTSSLVIPEPPERPSRSVDSIKKQKSVESLNDNSSISNLDNSIEVKTEIEVTRNEDNNSVLMLQTEPIIFDNPSQSMKSSSASEAAVVTSNRDATVSKELSDSHDWASSVTNGTITSISGADLYLADSNDLNSTSVDAKDVKKIESNQALLNLSSINDITSNVVSNVDVNDSQSQADMVVRQQSSETLDDELPLCETSQSSINSTELTSRRRSSSTTSSPEQSLDGTRAQTPPEKPPRRPPRPKSANRNHADNQIVVHNNNNNNNNNLDKHLAGSESNKKMTINGDCNGSNGDVSPLPPVEVASTQGIQKPKPPRPKPPRPAPPMARSRAGSLTEASSHL